MTCTRSHGSTLSLWTSISSIFEYFSQSHVSGDSSFQTWLEELWSRFSIHHQVPPSSASCIRPSRCQDRCPTTCGSKAWHPEQIFTELSCGSPTEQRLRSEAYPVFTAACGQETVHRVHCWIVLIMAGSVSEPLLKVKHQGRLHLDLIVHVP